jgi:hypothetical protein
MSQRTSIRLFDICMYGHGGNVEVYPWLWDENLCLCRTTSVGVGECCVDHGGVCICIGINVCDDVTSAGTIE